MKYLPTNTKHKKWALLTNIRSECLEAWMVFFIFLSVKHFNFLTAPFPYVHSFDPAKWIWKIQKIWIFCFTTSNTLPCYMFNSVKFRFNKKELVSFDWYILINKFKIFNFKIWNIYIFWFTSSNPLPCYMFNKLDHKSHHGWPVQFVGSA